MNLIESTLVMIKPDAPKRGLVKLIANEIMAKSLIFTHVGYADFDLTMIQNFYRWTCVQCPDVVKEYLCNKGIPLWIVQGDDAVKKTMEIKLRLRRTLCNGSHQNLMHCSSSIKNFRWEYTTLRDHGMIFTTLGNLQV